MTLHPMHSPNIPTAELGELRARAAKFVADNPPPPLTDEQKDRLAILRPSTGGVGVEPSGVGTSQPPEAA